MRNQSILGLLLFVALCSSFTLSSFTNSTPALPEERNIKNHLREDSLGAAVPKVPGKLDSATAIQPAETTKDVPIVTLSFQPMENSAIVYQPVAARSSKHHSKAQVSVIAYVRNDGWRNLNWTTLSISYDQNGKTTTRKFDVNKTIKPGHTKSWQNSRGYNEMGQVIQIVSPIPDELTFVYEFETGDKMIATRALKPYRHPTPSGNYLFPFHAKDFEEGEYVAGQSRHGNDGQVFALDLFVVKDAKINGVWFDKYPNTPSSKNESYRCYGKPIYSMTEGEVYHFRNDMPENPFLCSGDKCGIDYASYDEPECAGGCGNHFIIKTGDEYIFYGHLQKGSLNKNLLKKGAKVARGQYLGKVGNSGTSGGPHLHIDVQKHLSVGQVFRPMVFEGALAISRTSFPQQGAFARSDALLPWSVLNGNTIPEAESIIKPFNFIIPSLGGKKVAVFRRSNAEEQAVYGVDYASFRRKYDKLWKDGWRLHLLENHVYNNHTLSL